MILLNHFLVLLFIVEYFTNRSKYEQYLNGKIHVTSAFWCSPGILFCLFMNDISSISNTTILLLVDGAKIYKDINCIDYAFKLQIDLNNIY